MTFRTDTRWRWALALCGLWAFASLGTQRAHAHDQEQVLLLAPGEAELAARIQGQTRDLGVTLEVSGASAPKDAEAGRATGRTRGAAIVVWLERRAAAGLDLHVLDVESGELRTRRVSTPEKETLATSTTAEMAALVVRSELSALLSERKARREQTDAGQEPAPSQPALAAVQGRPLAPPNAPGADAIQAEPREPWTLALAYRPSRPFRSTFLHGVALGVRRDLAGFALGLSAIASLPVSLAKAGTRIRLNRTQLRLEGHKRWPLAHELQVLLGAAAGLSVDFRSTKKVVAPMVRTDDAATLTGSFGLLAQLEWRFSAQVGASLGFGADAVPWRTKFVYEDGQASPLLARLSWLDAWAMVGFFTRFGA